PNQPTTTSIRMMTVAKTGRRTQISANHCIAYPPGADLTPMSPSLNRSTARVEPALDCKGQWGHNPISALQHSLGKGSVQVLTLPLPWQGTGGQGRGSGFR